MVSPFAKARVFVHTRPTRAGLHLEKAVHIRGLGIVRVALLVMGKHWKHPSVHGQEDGVDT